MSVESRTEFQTSEILQDTMPSSTPLDTDGETLTHDSAPYTLAKIYRYLVGISKAVLGEATRRNSAKRVQGLEQALTGSITTSSTAVTGSSTLFLTELYVGALIAGTSGEYREIAAIASDTSATLVVAFSSDIGSAQLFTRLQSLAERVDSIESYTNAAQNGNLLGWAAASSFSTPASNTELADNFYANYDGSIGTFAVSRNEFTLGQTDVPGEPQYYMRWNQTAGGSGQATKRIRLKLTGVRSFAGQNMQVTFYAKMGSSTAITVGATQYFGSGGSPSADVVVTAKSRTMLTAFSRHTVTLAIPSITGKSLGTDVNDALYINFNLPLNATHDFYLATVAAYEGTAELPPQPGILTTGFITYLKALLKTYFDTLYSPIAWNVAWDTIAGVGATDTQVVYFTNKNVDTSGGDLTIVNNSTNGLRLTIVTSGVYALGFWLTPTGGGLTLGVSLNSNQLTTNVESITAANRLCLGTAAQDNAKFVSATKKLLAGNVIRAHVGTIGGGNGANANSGFFITRLS